ncbi:MAG: hypothetical protein IT210_08750 [Armatimonadetes bacterium]|nr:hypothetical protein [Armatimonadota bacterium]
MPTCDTNAYLRPLACCRDKGGWGYQGRPYNDVLSFWGVNHTGLGGPILDQDKCLCNVVFRDGYDKVNNSEGL